MATPQSAWSIGDACYVCIVEIDLVRFLDYKVTGMHMTIDDPYIKKVFKKTVDMRFYYCMRTKAKLKEERKRSSKLNLSCFLFVSFLVFCVPRLEV